MAPELSVVEIVGSAVVGEAVSRVCSYLIDRRGEAGGEAEARENEERMEVALLRIQAAVEEADDWHIINRPLVRWREKLRQAAVEGECVLLAYKHRAAEEDAEDKGARRRWFPKRIARAGKKLAVAFGGGPSGGQLEEDAVRRFERLADGVGDFMRLVETGGRAKRFVPFQPLAASLLARKAASCSVSSSSGATARAFAFPDLTSPWNRPRAHVVLRYVDGTTSEKLELFVELVLSESADVMAIVLACMGALPPHFRFASAAAFGSFHRLQAQDMTPETDDNRPTWNAHCSSQPTWREQEHSIATGYGRAPEAVAALPEEVLFIVAERDSPATPRMPPVHVSYHLGRHDADLLVRRARRTERFLEFSFGTRGVDRYPDADAEVFDGLVLQTVDEVRRRNSASAMVAQVVRWCFLSGWMVYFTVREIGARPAKSKYNSGL